MERLDALTGMRGVAALLVVGFHAVLTLWLAQITLGWEADAFEHPLSRLAGLGGGWVGVDFFFVLSGFLLSWPLLASPRALPTWAQYKVFAAKRLLRIAPPYYASFLVIYLLAGWTHHPIYDTSLKGIVIHALYLHNFFLDQQFAMSGVAWTLAIELQFYLLLPLMALAFRGKDWVGPTLACLVFLLAALVYEQWAYVPGDGFATRYREFQFPAFLAHFAFGMAVAKVMQSRWRPRMNPDLGVVLGVILFLILPAMLLGYTRQFEPVDAPGYFLLLRPAAGLGFALAILFALQPGSILGRWLATRPLRWLGDISYSLYLTHLAVGGFFLVGLPVALHRLGIMDARTVGEAIFGIGPPWMHLPAFTVLLLATSVPFAWGFYRLVERPSLRMKDRVAAFLAEEAAAKDVASARPADPESRHA